MILWRRVLSKPTPQHELGRLQSSKSVTNQGCCHQAQANALNLNSPIYFKTERYSKSNGLIEQRAFIAPLPALTRFNVIHEEDKEEMYGFQNDRT